MPNHIIMQMAFIGGESNLFLKMGVGSNTDGKRGSTNLRGINVTKHKYDLSDTMV